jgi:hypothetical protein
MRSFRLAVLMRGVQRHLRVPASAGAFPQMIARAITGRSSAHAHATDPRNSFGTSASLRLLISHGHPRLLTYRDNRAMSSIGGGNVEDKVKPEGIPMFLSLPGSVEAHTVKVNKEKRLIVGLEATMLILAKEIGKEIPGVVSTLNDNGLPEIRWSPAQTEGVLAYLKAHEFSAVDASFVYQGAFAGGVKKVALPVQVVIL